MPPAALLRKKLSSQESVLGILITNHLWLELIEISMESGLDYVIIDQEHFSHDCTAVADCCRLGRMTGFPVLLRPARTDAAAVRLAMDLGPCGLLLPMIESAAQLDEVRDGAWLPPRGGRRPGGHGNRWVRQFQYEDFRSGVEDDLIILPQVESPAGLENAAGIAGHALTTALAVGPYDLSCRLGCPGVPDDSRIVQAISHLRDTAQQAGKPFWMIGDGPTLRAQGHRFLCLGEPIGLLQRSLTALVGSVRRI